MMRINASRSRSFRFAGLAAIIAAVVTAGFGLLAPRAASAQSVEVLRPVANAIVRENVEIKVSPRDVPPDGYVAVSVDDDVVIAKILPTNPKDPIFVWDTKQPYYSADDPTTQKFVTDGTHNITITIYSSGNHLVGSATIPVRVANKISVSPQGAMLKYKWKLDETLSYHRKVTVTEVNDTSAMPAAAPTAPAGPGYPGGGGYPGYPGGGGAYPGGGGAYPGGGGGYPGFRGAAGGYGGPPGGGAPVAANFARGPYGGGYPGMGGGGYPGMGGGFPGMGGGVMGGGGGGPLDNADIHFERTVEDASLDQYLLRDKVTPENGFVSSNGSTQFVKTAYNLKSKYRTVNEFGEVLSEMPPLSPGDHFAFPIPVLPGRRVNVGDSWQTPIDVCLDWMGTDPLTVTGEARLEDFEWQNGYPVAKIHETYTGATKFQVSTKSVFSDAPVENLNVDQTVYFAYNAGRLIRVDAANDITVDLTSAQQTALNPFSGRGGGIGQTAGFPGGGGFPGMRGPFGGGGVPGGIPGGIPMGARGPMAGGGPFGGGAGAGGAGVGEARGPVHLKITELTELEK